MIVEKIPARILCLAALMMSLAGAAVAVHAQPTPHEAHEAHHSAASAAPAARTAPELGTSAAVDARGVLWVAGKSANSQGKPVVVLRSSADMGQSWSTPQQVVQDAVTARGEERPQIAFGPKGEMFILYTSPLAGSRNPHVGNIRLLRSLDGGKTFSAPATVHANGEAVVHAFGNLVVDREGTIYVVWVDGRDVAAAKAKRDVYAGSALYYAVSTDGGASFKGDYKIADHTCECCRIGLSLDEKGRPVAMWRHIFEGSVRDHALATLAPDGKAGQLQRASFDDWRVQACPHHGPSLAFAADGVRHQVWFNGKEGEGSGALYARVTANGKMDKPTPLGSAQASHPDVALLGQHVAVVWKQFKGESTAIFLRLSHDGGQAWQEKELAHTAGESDRPRLVNTRFGIYLLWNTLDEGLRVIPVAKERT